MVCILVILAPLGQRTERTEVEVGKAYATRLGYGKRLTKPGRLRASETLRSDAQGMRELAPCHADR